MYILGDIYVVELEIFLSRAFTCSQASLFTLFRALYSELLNEFEQVEWLGRKTNAGEIYQQHLM